MMVVKKMKDGTEDGGEDGFEDGDKNGGQDWIGVWEGCGNCRYAFPFWLKVWW